MSDTAMADKAASSQENIGKTSAADSFRMPETAFDMEAARANAVGDGERNAVFSSLVTSDGDIVGLVAYSIYKQNKHDWLVAFNKLKAREPNEDELYAYIVGESTPRRLAIYRHLAEATLEGRGPRVNVGPASEKFAPRGFAPAAAAQAPRSGGGAMAWLVAFVVAVAAVLLAGKYGIPGLR